MEDKPLLHDASYHCIRRGLPPSFFGTLASQRRIRSREELLSFPGTMGLIASILQFFVAGYALRLNRLFGTARVGWSLFGAFGLLALLHLISAMTPSRGGVGLGGEVEVVYSFIALLLLTGMVHLETMLKERVRLEGEEKRLRGELELEIQKKTAHLIRAIEELQAEIDERKKAEAVFKVTLRDLVAAQH